MGPNVITRVFISEKETRESWVRIRKKSEDGGRGHKPSNAEIL